MGTERARSCASALNASAGWPAANSAPISGSKESQAPVAEIVSTRPLIIKRFTDHPKPLASHPAAAQQPSRGSAPVAL